MSIKILCDGPCKQWLGKDKKIYEVDKSVRILAEVFYKKEHYVKYMCEDCIEYLNNHNPQNWKLKPIVTLEKNESDLWV